MNVPDSFLESLRQQVDIVEVVSEYVQLRKNGRSLTGLCPFHNERTPSFSVSPERQMYHCFGCGAGGTVFRFIMDIEGLPFAEAVAYLAERQGIALPANFGVRHITSNPKLERFREAHALAAKVFNHILMNTDAGVQALNYLLSRGISRTTIALYQLGFSPKPGNVLVPFLKRKGFTESELVECGLAIELGSVVSDRFRGRVMIPIADRKGQVVAFGGRAMDAGVKPKYLNSPEYELFHKSQLLFQYHVARKAIRKEKQALLLEGYMDVIAVRQAGIEHGVATLGTSLTEEQAHLLKTDCDKVVIAYDGDQAGRKATVRAIDILEGVGISPLVLRIPDGMDPDEYIRAHGGAAFARLLSRNTLSVVQFLLDEIRQGAQLVSAVGRTEFVRQALRILAERATPVEQEYELRNLSQEFNLSVETLKEELRTFSKQSRRRTFGREASGLKTVAQPLARAEQQASVRLLQAVLFSPEAAAYLMEKGLTELAEPLQTALLSNLYAWRLENPDGSPSAFVDQLEDESLAHFASSLFFYEVPEFSTALLDDYLRALELHRLEQLHRSLLRQWIEVEAGGDEEKSTEIKLQVERIQDQIATLKQPRAIHAE
ncbi:DNA primase [Alicyclobacillus sacchari]|uniref:DNA primase n=1 Tax=Alicyclobacillus sacchari TaxID=392010 RepID=A0A4R8LNY6_9BACL|nr:DNA primase [Alicyclobacillus sacchari]TDY48002.1 DNA primase [Alicyclobacillus sacchari]